MKGSKAQITACVRISVRVITFLLKKLIAPDYFLNFRSVQDFQ